MRNRIVMLSMLMCMMAPASAQQLSIGIWSPNVSIGINLPLYPDLVPVPGYPVYYAPRLDVNYFFYDGMYWVYEGDNWYASSWYNGPWGLVDPGFVPVYILRIPVRYYRRPPMYFRDWRSDGPPRWEEHWGNEWAQRHRGWDHWDRRSTPMRPPLPVYQRKYSGDQYPHVDQQRELQNRNYHYQPRDPVVRQHYQAQQMQSPRAPVQQQRREATPGKNFAPQGRPYSNPPATVRQNPSDIAHPQSPPQGTSPVKRQDLPPGQRELQRQQSGQREIPRQQQSPQESGREPRDHENERGQVGARGQDRGR